MNLDLLPLVVSGVGVAVAATLFVRNERVYRHQRAMLDRVHRAAMRDLQRAHALAEAAAQRGEPWERYYEDAGRAVQARYAWLQAASYSRMVWQFWRPLDSFYPPGPPGWRRAGDGSRAL